MRLHHLVVADPVESVARQIATDCERLAEERATARTGERTLELVTTLRPEMVILSLEVLRPAAAKVAAEIQRLLPETFVIITFRELAVPTMERLGRLNVGDFMPQPLDLTAVFRAASRRFGVPFRRHDRHNVALDVVRADGVLIGRTVDLSEGGLCMSALHPATTDGSMLVDLMLGGGSPLRVRLRVLAVEGRPPLPVTVRAQFDRLRRREHERLSAFIAGLVQAHRDEKK